MSWMQTRTGKAFDLVEPRAKDVSVFDIASALAGLCRFTGHVDHYSVAEHCCHVSDFLWEHTPAEESHAVALAGLLHDAHEAYTGDCSWPMQCAIGDAARAAIKGVQGRVDESILVALGVPHLDLHDPRVKQADVRILLTERNALMGPPPQPWYMENSPPLPVTIEGWSPSVARAQWLRRLNALLPKVRR